MQMHLQSIYSSMGAEKSKRLHVDREMWCSVEKGGTQMDQISTQKLDTHTQTPDVDRQSFLCFRRRHVKEREPVSDGQTEPADGQNDGPPSAAPHG